MRSRGVLYEIQSSDEGRIQAQYWLALIERAEEIGREILRSMRKALGRY